MGTSSGKNTLHGRVSILYQNIRTEEELNIIQRNDASRVPQQNVLINVRDLSGRRRRLFEEESFEYLLHSHIVQNFGIVSAGSSENIENFKKFNTDILHG